MATRTRQKVKPVALATTEEKTSNREVLIDQTGRFVRVRDDQVFRAGRRSFCRRLVQFAARRPGVQKAAIDITEGSCVIEFLPEWSTTQHMAETFASAVHEALASASKSEGKSWWQDKNADWEILSAYPRTYAPSLWEARDVGPSSIRIRKSGIQAKLLPPSRIAKEIGSMPGVERCRTSWWSPEIEVDAKGVSKYELLDRAEQAGRLRGTQSMLVSPSSPPELPALGSHWHRAMYLALAGGSFVLALIAIVVPGIPSVPLLLATTYFLARSSPKLHDKLLASPFFGPILHESEELHGLSWRSKEKLIGLILVATAFSILIAMPSPPMLALILFAGLASAFGVTQMHGIVGRPLQALPVV